MGLGGRARGAEGIGSRRSRRYCRHRRPPSRLDTQVWNSPPEHAGGTPAVPMPPPPEVRPAPLSLRKGGGDRPIRGKPLRCSVRIQSSLLSLCRSVRTSAPGLRNDPRECSRALHSPAHLRLGRRMEARAADRYRRTPLDDRQKRVRRMPRADHSGRAHGAVRRRRAAGRLDRRAERAEGNPRAHRCCSPHPLPPPRGEGGSYRRRSATNRAGRAGCAARTRPGAAFRLHSIRRLLGCAPRFNRRFRPPFSLGIARDWAARGARLRSADRRHGRRGDA